jgi:predicted metal-dependent enzyme (double-stranded beta helix superfamily)
MCDTGYSLRGFVADLRAVRSRARDEREMLAGVREHVRELQRYRDNWLRPSMCLPGAQPGTAGVHQVHEEADHSLAIFVVTWLPGEETPPHDHATWAVIAGLRGQETQHWWKRLDDGTVEGYAEVERSHHERIGPGSIVTMGSEAIHSLHNDSGGLSVTLHVYGVNVDFTERFRFDPAARTRSSYRMGGTVAAA